MPVQCPVCGHERSAPFLRCSSCGTTFPREVFERYDHLKFLLAELDDWAHRGLISESLRQALAKGYQQELEALEAERESKLAEQRREEAERERRRREAEAAAARDAEARRKAAEEAKRLARERREVEEVRRRAVQGRRIARQKERASGEEELEAAAPSLARPRFNWENIWQALLSPRALEALLYVGAFLIIAAAGTFVYFNWGRFPPTIQLLFLAVGTASFFAAGWVIETRWHLPQSGATLIGIGALIIPVDFYAWVRFRNLPPESYPVIWLTASAFCTVVYAATTRWMRHRFFLVITMLAVHSLVLSALQLNGVPAVWWGAATVAVATGWVALQPAVDRIGKGLQAAAFATAVAAATAGIVVPLILSSDRWSSLGSVTAPVGSWIFPIAAAWWAGGIFFASVNLARRSTAAGYAAMEIIPVAIILTLLPVFPRPWISAAILGLAPVYVVLGRRRGGALGAGAANIGAFLPIVALAWAWMDLRTVAAIYLASGALYLWWAFWRPLPVLALAGQALGTFGLVVLLHVLHVPQLLWALALFGAGVAGLGLAAVSPRAPAVAKYLYLGAYALVVLAVLAPPPIASIHARILLVGGTLLVAIYSAVRSHRGRDLALQKLVDGSILPGPLTFQWISAVLASAELLLVWHWRRPDLFGLPVAALLLGTLFVLVGRRLASVAWSYPQPWISTALLLSAAASVAAAVLADRGQLILTLLLLVASYALWGWLLAEPAFIHVAAWLFLVPFVLLLPEVQARGWLPSREAYAWAFVELGVAYLLIGVLTDRLAPRVAVPWHVLSQLLVPFAMLWALQEEQVARWTLAIAILFYAISAVLVHVRGHPTHQRFVDWVARRAPVAAGPARAGFIYAAAWLFPFWFHLTLRHVPVVGDVHARLGIAAAALAWAYLGLGQWLRRADETYVPPLRIAAQALAVVGSLLTADQRPALMVAMTLGVALQLGFYALTRNVLWVYTAALGGAGLFGIALRHLDAQAAQAGWAMIALGGAYLALGEWIWRRVRTSEIPPVTMALFAVAFLNVAVGLLLSSFRGPADAAIAYALGAIFFLLSGWRLRETLFGYPVAGLLAAAYVAGLVGLRETSGGLESQSGIWLVPGIAIFFVVALLLERLTSARTQAVLVAWAGPFYLAAHLGTVALLISSAQELPVFLWSLLAATVVYAASVATFRSPLWLYPGLLTLHLALFLGLLRIGIEPRLIPAAFVPVTMLVALVGRQLERRGYRNPVVAKDWVLPWYVIGLAGMTLWELAGIIDLRTHILTSVGFAFLVGAFTRIWKAARAASLSLVLLLIGFAQTVRWLQLPYPAALLAFSLLAVLLGVGEVGARSLRRAELWRPGLRTLALVVSAGAVVTSIWGVMMTVHPAAGTGLVYALAIVGLLYLLYGIADRREWLAYLAVAMLQAAWAIFLLKGLEVRELQWYAIPAAAYLLGIGAVERRLGRKVFAQIVDLAGLTLLFGSSLWQSLGPNGFPYAALLAVEAVLVIVFGAAQRLRRHFFGGLGVLVADVVIQVIDPLRSLDKTILFLSLGIILVVVAVLAERKREEIIRTTREWWGRLEAWE